MIALAQKIRLLFADRGVERWDYADDTDFARALSFRNVHQRDNWFSPYV